MTVLSHDGKAGPISRKTRMPAREDGRARNPHLNLDIDLGVVRYNVEATRDPKWRG
jgi:hypothetical protein